MATLSQIIDFAIEYAEAHVGGDGSEETYVTNFIDALAQADFQGCAEIVEEAPEEWDVEEAAHSLLSELGATGENAFQQYVSWKEAGSPPKQDAEDSDWDASRRRHGPAAEAARRAKKQ